MPRKIHRFSFAKDVPIEDVENALIVARVAAEGVHGETAVCLDACYALSEERPLFVVDATDPIGTTIARVFTAVLLRTIGEDAFEVEHRMYEDRVVPRAGHAGARR
jgi:hypothetical protein